MKWNQLGSLAVIDVETTGVDAKSDRVISVAVIRTEFASTGEELRGDTLAVVVNPGRSIPWQASRINGFTDEGVAGKPSFADEAEKIRAFIGDRELVGHNVSFDKRFLSAEFKRAGVKTLHRNRSHCTMRAACSWLSEITGWWSSSRISLDRALEIFDVQARSQKVHDALEDAKLTALLASRLCQLEVLPKSRTASLRQHVRDHASNRQHKRQRIPAQAMSRERAPNDRQSHKSKPLYRQIGFWGLVLLLTFLLLRALLSSD